MRRLLIAFLPLALPFLLVTQAFAAITFVGSAANSAADGANVTVTLPTAQEDDLVIVAYGIGSITNTDYNLSVVTADYAEVADLFSNDNRDTNLGVFWKVMGETPDTDVEVTGSAAAADSTVAVVMVFRGVDTTTPMDVTPTTVTILNTFDPDPPSIDYTTASGVWTVIAGAGVHDQCGACAAGTYTFPAGYTTDKIDRVQDDSSDTTVGLGYNSSPADPEDPGVMAHGGTDAITFSSAAATLALRPAAAAASRRPIAPMVFQ